MSKIAVFSTLFGLLLLTALVGGCAVTGCTTVPPGYAGVKVNLLGDQRGVNDFPVKTGLIWYNRFTQEVHTFPTFMQNMVWTQDTTEESPIDESITFQTAEGLTVNADIGIAFQIEHDKVPYLFVSLRRDIKDIIHGYLRNQVRDAFTHHAPKHKAMDILSTGSTALREEVKNSLVEHLGPMGFKIDAVTIVGEMRVDQRIKDAINATLTAKNRAIEAENKVNQTKAEAEQRIEQARGEAEAIKLKAMAQAEANRTLTESLTPELIQYQSMLKWNGQLPKVMGSEAVPFIQLDEGKK